MMKSILKHALKNALEFNGKVNAKVVLGHVLRENPELKKDVPKLLKEIDLVINDVEKLSLTDIKKQLQTLAPELLREKKAELEGPLKPLPNAVKGKVVLRIAPSPSGPLHIGHAYGVSLNYEYAKMYHGKLILRIEDTNPENIYEPAYGLIERDAQWLTDNGISEVIVQSSRLGSYYDRAEQLVRKGKAYVCTCDADQWRKWKNDGKACPCRSMEVKGQQTRYAKMFAEYAEGEAVLRLKTNITDKNPAMRDFAIMRVNEHVHPKTGKEQKVWPLMVFAVAVDDHELGITHVLNGKDHADNAAKERMIMEDLGWKAPEYKHWGRINFEGFELSTSKTRIAIEQNIYKNWEDIRLPFLPALRKNGYQAAAFRKFALEIGLSLNDKTVAIHEFWKMINAFNRELIEPNANRYFFVDDPQKVSISKAPAKNAAIDLHPNFPERGKRILEAAGKVYLSKADVEKLEEGKIHRLMDYCNFKVQKGKYLFVSELYEEFKKSEQRGVIIHWLPQTTLPEVQVELGDGTIAQGLGEDALRTLKKDTIIQLERRYYARIDKIAKNEIYLRYLHA